MATNIVDCEKARKSSPETSNGYCPKVARIVKDARQRFSSRNFDRGETLFYCAVRGGNTGMVKKTLHFMRNEDCHKAEVNWLLGLQSSQGQDQADCASFCKWIIRNWLLIMVNILLLVLAFTPVFSAAKAMFSDMYTSIRSKRYEKLCKNSLPLFLALQGNSKTILMLFKDSMVRLNQKTGTGNNIFHLLVEYSRIQPDKALDAYRRLLEVYTDAEEVKQWALGDINQDGLTAFELCAKSGAPRFFKAMTGTRWLLSDELVNVTPHEFKVAAEARTRDKGSLVFRNKLMIEEESPNQGATTEEDKLSGNESTLVHVEPGSDKSTTPGEKNMYVPLADDEENRVIYSMARYDVTQYEYGGIFNRQSMVLTLLSKRDLEELEDEDMTILLTNNFVNRWYEVKGRYLNWVLLMNYVYLFLWTTVAAYFCVMVSQEGDPDTPSFALMKLVLKELKAVHSEFYTMSPNSTSYEEICPDKGDIFENITVDICEKEAMMRIANKCTATNLQNMLLESSVTSISDIWHFSGRSLILLQVLTVAAAYVLLKGIFVAMLFLVQNFRQRPLSVSIRRVFVVPIPGSHLDCFLQQVEAWLFIVFSAYIHMLNTTDTFATHLFSHVMIASNLFTVFAILLGITFLVSLRIMPVVGHFIVTTIHLAKCLAQFVVVYGVVFVSTSSLFLLIMRNPDCDVENLSGFQNMYLSMYEAYKLLYGVGDFHFDLDLNSRMLHIIYSIYCILLLLNLIIAVMSRAADELFNKLCKKLVAHNFYLGELLVYESAANLLFALLGRQYYLKVLEHAGFVVGKTSDRRRGKHEVFLDVEM